MPRQQVSSHQRVADLDSEIGFRHERGSTENVLKTTMGLAAEAPSALYNQLSEDLRTPGKIAKTTAVSAGVGFGVTALLSKAPKVGGVVVAGLAGYQALHYGAETLNFIGEARHANTDLKRNMLVEQYSKGLARETAMMIEGTPGMLLGGSAAVKLVGMPNSYRTLGGIVDRNAIQPMRNASLATKEFAAEQWAFRGPGRIKLSSQMLSSEGKVNALELGEMLSAKHPWTGVEMGRSVDLLKMRVSRPIKGDATSVTPAFPDKPGRILFHTHAPDSPIGTRPGHFDLLATQDVGIISRGSQTAFYVGQAREYNAALRAGIDKVFAPKMQTLVLDSQKQTAFTLESMWVPQTQTWQPAVPRFVDYQTARATMQKLDITKPWAQIADIPALPSMRGHNIDFSSLSWLRTGVR